jgi:hypothetical protein
MYLKQVLTLAINKNDGISGRKSPNRNLICIIKAIFVRIKKTRHEIVRHDDNKHNEVCSKTLVSSLVKTS